MIIKLYKSEGNWCFDYKQKTHIISGINRLLDSFCDITNMSKIYIKLNRTDIAHLPKENEYLCYLDTWEDNNQFRCNVTIGGNNFQAFVQLLNCENAIWTDIMIYPFISLPRYMVVTKIK